MLYVVLLGFDPLHSLTFGALWTSAVGYIQTAAPPGLMVTAQSIMGAVFGGLGLGIGSLASGFVYTNYGPELLFSGASAWMLLAYLIFAISNTLRGCKKHSKRRGPDINERTSGEIVATGEPGIVGDLYEEEEDDDDEANGDPYNPDEATEDEQRILDEPPWEVADSVVI